VLHSVEQQRSIGQTGQAVVQRLVTELGRQARLVGDVVGGDHPTIDFGLVGLVGPNAANNGVINAKLGSGLANAIDGRTVQVRAPRDPNARVNFLADLEELPLEATIPSAKVVINARTGSVVMNQTVSLSACAVAHGNLSVTINSTPVISQPSPFSTGGQTVVKEKADITIKQEPGALIQLPAGTQLADVVKALSALGATPQDLLAILQAMKSAGALNAEIEVI
jgi:flagellar P-ring protein precursor FlgI